MQPSVRHVNFQPDASHMATERGKRIALLKSQRFSSNLQKWNTHTPHSPPNSMRHVSVHLKSSVSLNTFVSKVQRKG